MDQDKDTVKGQSHVPKPPSREEIEKISEAQQYITDDWTGDGGKPGDDVPEEGKDTDAKGG